MKKRLIHIAPLQNGLVLAVLYGAIYLILVPFIIIGSMIGSKTHGNAFGLVGGLMMALFIPILYAALGFIGGIIGAAVYNLVAKWTGGIEFTVADVLEDASAAL